MVEIVNSLYIAASGMKAQSDRLRIISQNIANVDSEPTQPGELPYRRKIISFRNELDKTMGVELVKVSRYDTDKSEFGKRYDPGHPAADEKGYVQTPNVNSMIELVDMKEARRAYEANVDVIEVSKEMLSQTVNMLR